MLSETDRSTSNEIKCPLEDDYASTAKPQIDWDDHDAREELIDSRARDGYALLALLDDHELGEGVDKAVRLLATVLGQGLADDGDGVFRIVRKGLRRERARISSGKSETRLHVSVRESRSVPKAQVRLGGVIGMPGTSFETRKPGAAGRSPRSGADIGDGSPDGRDHSWALYESVTRESIAAKERFAALHGDQKTWSYARWPDSAANRRSPRQTDSTL
ncbi:hypothetical protein ACWDKQ_25690 [Saccharopolyspora sp. NPDC000995]